jgi:chromosome segregation ATPase
MSQLLNNRDLGAAVGIIGLVTGWAREIWRWLDGLKKKADTSEIDERRVMIEEFKAFREAYHDDKEQLLERISTLECRLEDAETLAAGLKDKLSERTIQYQQALKRIEELLTRIAALEQQISSPQDTKQAPRALKTRVRRAISKAPEGAENT